MGIAAIRNPFISCLVLAFALSACGGSDKNQHDDGDDAGDEDGATGHDDGGDDVPPGPDTTGFQFDRAFMIYIIGAPNGGGMAQPVAIGHSLYLQGILADGKASQVERLVQWVERRPNPNPKSGEVAVYIKRAQETSPNTDTYGETPDYVCWVQEQSGVYALNTGSEFMGVPTPQGQGGCEWTLEAVDLPGKGEGYFRIRSGLDAKANYLSQYPTTPSDGGTLAVGAEQSVAPMYRFVGADMSEGRPLPE